MVAGSRHRALRNPGNPGVISVSDWAVLGSPLLRYMLEKGTRERCSQVAVWGDVHELCNHSDYAEYQSRRYVAQDFKPSYKLLYIGETSMSDDELDKIGD